MTSIARNVLPIELEENAALIVIDVQKGHDDPRFGRRNNPDAEQRIAALLDMWRRTGRPVVHVQHSSRNEHSAFHASSPGFALKEEVLPHPGETLLVKSESSAFMGTSLEQLLKGRGIETLVLVGLTTPHCVSTTARMAGNMGFRTYVVADATAANDGTADWSWAAHRPEGVDADTVHAISLATLHGEFVTVIQSGDIASS
jgi:nicotinamidase-related amidase